MNRSRATLALLVTTFGCGDGITGGGGDDEPDLPICELPQSLLSFSVAKDAIPSLLQPDMVTIGDPGMGYLLDSDRVLGVVVDGQPRAYPHNIMWHHEIVSDKVGDRWVTATFCPLTGSGIVFDPHAGAEQLDLGVSGLLFANNLVLYDRTSGDVYGPQLSVDGKCSRFTDQTLDILPVQELSWGRWRTMHPNTTVVTSDNGFGRNYRVSPYADYITNDDILFEMPVDASRPLKERVLAVRVGSGGPGYPFGELADSGDVVAINDTIDGEPTAIFFESTDGEAAVAFYATVDGQTLTFDPGTGERWVDRETDSRWSIDGRATSGPLTGKQLQIREDAFVVYWFAWRHFQPDGAMWSR